MVYASAVLHLFNKETAAAFAKAAITLMMPGGLFIGGTCTSDPPGPFGHSEGGAGNMPYLHTPAGFKSTLEEAGYRDIRIENSSVADALRR